VRAPAPVLRDVSLILPCFLRSCRVEVQAVAGIWPAVLHEALCALRDEHHVATRELRASDRLRFLVAVAGRRVLGLGQLALQDLDPATACGVQRGVRGYQNRSSGKYWRLSYKLSKNGAEKSKHLVGFGRIAFSETEARNWFRNLA
jgi:hypothetical protein